MRDGTILRADIFRPHGSEQVPAMLVWSPYGKTGAGMINLDFMPARAGIPRSALSGYEKFEGPDPAEWVPRGYAVVNTDARGVFDSEGDVRTMGTPEGQDGYDTVEHIARLPWCTGAVCLVGNSWLAMAQYHIAAQQPPHLKCIAPLEGLSDMFRESMCRGGVPSPAFFAAVTQTLSGRGQIEDLASMLEMYPDWNEYWADKRADFSKVKVPAYILASYSTCLHTEGSFRCYEEMSAPKWLTVHDTQEWGRKWMGGDTTCSSPNITNHVMQDWPPPTASYKRLFLSDSGKLAQRMPDVAHTREYQSDFPAQQHGKDSEELCFSYVFAEHSYLLGTSVAELFVSCPDHDDLDIFLQLTKADSTGKQLSSLNIPLDKLAMLREDVPPVNILQYVGPTGMVRASRRELDSELSKPHAPQLSLRTVDKVPPGDVVKCTVGIWPGGMIFAPGEQLLLKISGHPMTLAEFPMLWGSYKPSNQGKHRVHFGGEFASFVEIPFVQL
ncbi:hypothetical protein LTR36_010365 [Oleoguttula mirabilis]|uniref:Xaa-Pro dipeptidyl-peptidase C-terminal domain-containing protein n=1 Tax=Oleoguttula mirabilis TaxID=1507867 RepID=A0AAV9J574_9PEZI|nr:hypothetical protein LTR36_010365 [Oleoguttula mirabilis]